MDAVVLGGGGPVGAAWTSAILHGLLSAGVPVGEADIVLGTSAGAVVGSWLTMQPTGLPSVPELMRRRADWHAANARSGHTDRSVFERAMRSPTAGATATAVADATLPPISVEQAEAMWSSYLPEGPWAPNLAVTSVDAKTGQGRVWSAADDVSVPLAVACSTAAPGVAPPVATADGIWVDGGVRSSTNADLILEIRGDNAQDIRHGKVLMFRPLPNSSVAREQAALVERGFAVRVINANPFYAEPTQLLDAAFIDIGAAAGGDQARDLSAALTSWLAE
ncbi:hypothetical protein A5647_05785 [Mycobacterium sp. 1100029.7]|nr:hypothetical protein A5647_05785 [Mycobacterium sp. 1100029.7]